MVNTSDKFGIFQVIFLSSFTDINFLINDFYNCHTNPLAKLELLQSKESCIKTLLGMSFLNFLFLVGYQLAPHLEESVYCLHRIVNNNVHKHHG